MDPTLAPPPWGPGPGLMRGPPPYGIPPPGWPVNRPPEEGLDPEAAEDWSEDRNDHAEEGRPEEMDAVNKHNSMDQPNDERD